MTSSFYAGNAKLPAGTYTLRQMQDVPDAFNLQNSSGRHTVLLEGRPSSKTTIGNPVTVEAIRIAAARFRETHPGWPKARPR